jgi:osmotically-inducible protein OsmY
MTTRLQKETTVNMDRELQQQVIDELSWDPRVDAAAIGVSVDSGVIVLSGTVRSLSEKWAAERATERVRGVKAISDEIVVEPSGDFRRDDQDIARAAINALDWNASVPQGRIQVIVQNGWITLDGAVDGYFQKAEAERVVRSLCGVKSVVNRIAVKPPVSTADVKSQIVKALGRAAEIDAKKIWVEICDSRVILSGSVQSLSEREEAERAAWSAPGISAVVNSIEIA